MRLGLGSLVAWDGLVLLASNTRPQGNAKLAGDIRLERYLLLAEDLSEMT